MANNPKWQRARVLQATTDDQRAAVGKTIWIRAQRPHAMPFGWPTNIRHWDGTQMCMARADRIELLPEFAHDVPIILWEEFINGK